MTLFLVSLQVLLVLEQVFCWPWQSFTSTLRSLSRSKVKWEAWEPSSFKWTIMHCINLGITYTSVLNLQAKCQSVKEILSQLICTCSNYQIAQKTTTVALSSTTAATTARTTTATNKCKTNACTYNIVFFLSLKVEFSVCMSSLFI